MIVSTPANVVGTVEGTKQHFRTGGLNYLTFERIIERITFHDDIAIVMGDEIIRPPVDEDPSRFVMAKDLYHHLGKQVEVLVYYITQKPVRTKGGSSCILGRLLIVRETGWTVCISLMWRRSTASPEEGITICGVK